MDRNRKRDIENWKDGLLVLLCKEVYSRRFGVYKGFGVARPLTLTEKVACSADNWTDWRREWIGDEMSYSKLVVELRMIFVLSMSSWLEHPDMPNVIAIIINYRCTDCNDGYMVYTGISRTAEWAPTASQNWLFKLKFNQRVGGHLLEMLLQWFPVLGED